MAQRPAGRVAGREERGRHAHPVRPEQRHLGDGAGPARRRRRHPPASARSWRSSSRSTTTAFLDELPEIAGGDEARAAIRGFLDRYGMRCVGEIDITRPRWSERPTHARAGDPRQRQELRAGRRRAGASSRGGARPRQGARGAGAAARAARRRARRPTRRSAKIDRVRTFIGYREYPKYGMVCRYFIYKQALMAEAERLVRAGVLGEREDCFFLTFQELREVVRTSHGRPRADPASARRRSGRTRRSRPPRVLTSDGEIAGRAVPPRRPAGGRAGRPGGVRRHRRGAGPRHPRHGGRRPRAGRHPGDDRSPTPAGRRCSSRSPAW